MKKLLLGTTAIVAAAAIASPAVAAEKISLGLGGYMEQWIGFVSDDSKKSNNTDYRTFGMNTDTEVHFKGDTTLDNGLKFAVQIEIEADGQGANGTIDESWMEVSSSNFGALRLGTDDHVTARSHNSAPSYGAGRGDSNEWIKQDDIAWNNDSYVTGGVGDELKIAYYSPRYFGFQLGASYAPDADATNSRDSGSVNAINGDGDSYALVLTYVEDFNGVGVSADIGYVNTTGFGTTGATYVNAIIGKQAGLKVTYAGFEVAGGFGRTNYQVGSDSVDSSKSTEGDVWDLGVGYKSGPWGVSLSTTQGEFTGDRGGSATTNGNDEISIYELAGVYNLGPGIDVKGSLYYNEYDPDGNAAASTYSDGGWALVAGFALSF